MNQKLVKIVIGIDKTFTIVIQGNNLIITIGVVDGFLCGIEQGDFSWNGDGDHVTILFRF